MAAPWSKRLWSHVACSLGGHDWVNQVGELDDPGRPRFICARCGRSVTGPIGSILRHPPHPSDHRPPVARRARLEGPPRRRPPAFLIARPNFGTGGHLMACYHADAILTVF